MEKVTTMSFLGCLIQAKPPVILRKLLRLTVNHFYCSFKALSTFFKVSRVITLAPPTLGHNVLGIVLWYLG